jgi:hypothetical protein
VVELRFVGPGGRRHQGPSGEGAALASADTLLAALTAIGEHVAAEPDACRVLLEAMAQAQHLPGIAESTAASQSRLKIAVSAVRSCASAPKVILPGTT